MRHNRKDPRQLLFSEAAKAVSVMPRKERDEYAADAVDGTLRWPDRAEAASLPSCSRSDKRAAAAAAAAARPLFGSAQAAP